MPYCWSLLLSEHYWTAFWKTVVSLYCRLQFTKNTPDYTKLFLSRAPHSVKGKCFIVGVGKSRCIEERSKKKRTNWPAKTEHLWGFLAENLFVFQLLWWCNLQSERTAVTWKIWYLLVWSPSSQFKGSSSSSAVYCHYNSFLDCDSGLSPANTWFPIYICICMTLTSCSTVLRNAGL